MKEIEKTAIDNTKCKYRDPKTKDLTADQLETALTIRSHNFEDKHACLENSLKTHTDYDTNIKFYDEMRLDYDEWKSAKDKLLKSLATFIEFKPGEDKEGAMASRAKISERSNRMIKRVRDATERYVAAAQKSLKKRH